MQVQPKLLRALCSPAVQGRPGRAQCPQRRQTGPSPLPFMAEGCLWWHQISCPWKGPSGSWRHRRPEKSLRDFPSVASIQTKEFPERGHMHAHRAFSHALEMTALLSGLLPQEASLPQRRWATPVTPRLRAVQTPCPLTSTEAGSAALSPGWACAES